MKEEKCRECNEVIPAGACQQGQSFKGECCSAMTVAEAINNILQSINESVLEEREAIIKLVEKFILASPDGKSTTYDFSIDGVSFKESLIKSIRARGEK